MLTGSNAIRRRRALRLLIGGTAGLGLFGCGGGGTGGAIERETDQTGASPSAAPKTFDAEAEFSATANPNGPWSYGWSRTVGSPFVLDVRTDGMTTWSGPVHAPSALGSFFPNIEHHDAALFLRPGPNGEFAVLRFTAAVAGTYILLDGETISQMLPSQQSPEFIRSNPQLLMAGSTVDVAVGYGIDCTSRGDDTLIGVKLTLVS
jgi:hypothetical protein